MGHEMKFALKGGLCDGETVTLRTEWDGRGQRPPPFVRRCPKLSQEEVMAGLSGPAPHEERLVVETYHLHVFDHGNRRWYEYRPEPQR